MLFFLEASLTLDGLRHGFSVLNLAVQLASSDYIKSPI